MLLPPLNLTAIKTASFTPTAMTVHRLSGGRGIQLDTSEGPVYFIKEEDGSVRVLSSRFAKRDYNVETGDVTGVDGLLDLLHLQADTSLQPEDSFVLASELLQSLRWRGSDELEHDPIERKTYLVDALADPDAFLKTIALISDEEEVEEEVEETKPDETTSEEEVIKVSTPVTVETQDQSALTEVIAKSLTDGPEVII
jgi:hypothetical protein